MAPPTEEEIASVMEVLPQGRQGRSTAISLLERARTSGSNDCTTAALNFFFSGAAASTSTPASGAAALATDGPGAAAADLTPGGERLSSKPCASPRDFRHSSATSKSSSSTNRKTRASPYQQSALKPSSLANSHGSRKTSGTKRPRTDQNTQKQPSPSATKPATGPLAERVRPSALSDLVGQPAFTPESSLGKLLARDRFPSVILWGPPGCGKTTIAAIVAKTTKRRTIKLSATQAGVREVRSVVEEAANRRRLDPGSGTLLFLDEIHRWNKAQQDALLPHVESGLITLIGATTENPSFSLNNALLSRCKVVTIQILETDSLVRILKLAMSNPQSGLPDGVEVSDDALKGLATVANGDARQALNALELAVEMSKSADSSGDGPIRLSAATVKQALQQKSLVYDRDGEEHYNIISALHKSMRAGDTDASIYWLARMLEGGEDARYISRRLVRFAAEDVGLADPNALLQATAAHRAADKVGMPECDVILAQAVAYLARAPKSVAVHSAYKAAKRLVKDAPADPVPMHVRNAPTGLMKEAGYGEGYTYNPDHGYKRGCAEGLSFFPDKLKGTALFDEKDVEPGHFVYPFAGGNGKMGWDQNTLGNR